MTEMTPEHQKLLEIGERLLLPRVGRRLSLHPGPFPPHQKHWKNALPWQYRLELDPARIAAMREAFGIDDPSTDEPAQWESLLSDLTQGRLFLRVVPLHERYRIPPGQTRTQRQSRLNRWLPPPFVGNAAEQTLTWKTPVRFASPTKTLTFRPRQLPLLFEGLSFDDLREMLNQRGGFARWLDNGQIFMVVTPNNQPSPR